MLYKNKQLLDLRGKPIPPGAVRTTLGYQKGALKKLTPGEQAFCKLYGPVAKATGVRYVKQVVYYVTSGISFRSDFVFKKHRLIVEVDDPGHATKKEVDQWRDSLLHGLRGMKTVRFSNKDCLERYCWVRMRLLDALIDSEKGRKKELVEYREKLRNDKDFMESVRRQWPDDRTRTLDLSSAY